MRPECRVPALQAPHLSATELTDHSPSPCQLAATIDDHVSIVQCPSNRRPPPMSKFLSRTEVSPLVSYDGITGLFTWKERPASMFTTERYWKGWNTKWAGKPAFTVSCTTGYLSGHILNQQYLAHRIAWLLTFDEMPKVIDHINGNITDNRISNLRSVTQSVNMRNASIPAHNTSGHIGVRLCPRRLMWIVEIGRGPGRYVGSYPNIDDAISARKEAALKKGYHSNHGRPT